MATRRERLNLRPLKDLIIEDFTNFEILGFWACWSLELLPFPDPEKPDFWSLVRFELFWLVGLLTIHFWVLLDSFGRPLGHIRHSAVSESNGGRLWVCDRNTEHLRVGELVAVFYMRVTVTGMPGSPLPRTSNHRQHGQQSDPGQFLCIRDEDDCKCLCCWEPYSRKQLIHALPCGHRFHAHCIDLWFWEKRALSCPMCRQELGSDGVVLQ
jgi:hypothetical protein